MCVYIYIYIHKRFCACICPICLLTLSLLRLLDSKSSRELPMDMRIPPLIIEIMPESNPLKSRILARRLAVCPCLCTSGVRSHIDLSGSTITILLYSAILYSIYNMIYIIFYYISLYSILLHYTLMFYIRSRASSPRPRRAAAEVTEPTHYYYSHSLLPL